MLTRYTLASGLATSVSQAVLLGFTFLGHAPAAVASTAAFAAGAVPQFLLIRRWAAGTLPRQLAVYLLITAASGLISIGLVTLVDLLVNPLITNPELRPLALNLGYLLGGAPLFLAKYLALDRTFFAPDQHSGVHVGAR